MKKRDMYWDEDVLMVQNEVRRYEADKLNPPEENSSEAEEISENGKTEVLSDGDKDGE